jgi:hypothetical protein
VEKPHFLFSPTSKEKKRDMCLMAFIDCEYKSFISDVAPILSVRSKSKDSIVVTKVFSLLLCLCCVEQGRTEWLGVDNLKEYGGYRNHDLVIVSFLISWMTPRMTNFCKEIIKYRRYKSFLGGL